MLNPTRHHLIFLIVSVGVLVIFFAAPFVSTSISGELKIGVIDPDRVANDTILGKRMKGTLTEYLEGRQKVIDTDEKILRELEEELRTQGPLLSADARQAKQDSYQEQVIAYQQKVNEINRELQERRKVESEKYAGLLRGAVEAVAKREGFNLVLAKRADSGVVLFNDSNLDITSKVVEELDQPEKSSGAGPQPQLLPKK